MGMTATDSRSLPRIFAGHTLTGMIFGMLMGLAYFILEPLLGFSGRWEYLGMPLAGLFEVYLLFGLVVGLVAGAIVGLVSALLRRFDDPDLAHRLDRGDAAVPEIVSHRARLFSGRPLFGREHGNGVRGACMADRFLEADCEPEGAFRSGARPPLHRQFHVVVGK